MSLSQRVLGGVEIRRRQELLAEAQRDVAAGTPAVYVALTARATCLAIIRNGLVLFSREMPWGHGTEDPEAVDTDPVAAIATRLSAELRRSVLFFKQTFRAPVEHVILCGDMPNLRSLTGTLGTSLQVSVQTLDSMVGIDAVALPEPHDRFREEIAAILPPGLARWLMRQRPFHLSMHVRSTTIWGFARLRFLAGLRWWRPRAGNGMRRSP